MPGKRTMTIQTQTPGWETRYIPMKPPTLDRALVTEGLKVCDRYEATMWDQYSARNLDLIAAILRSAGRIK